MVEMSVRIVLASRMIARAKAVETKMRLYLKEGMLDDVSETVFKAENVTVEWIFE